MPELSFDEIKDWNQFEELVAAFFRSLRNSGGTNIAAVTVKSSGVGPDGGKDILVDFEVSEYIVTYKRTWVIQCKFVENTVTPGDIFGVDIPTLVHSYNACGYLLVCKNRPTSGLTQLFARLNEQAIHYKYKYEIWSGEEFRSKLLSAEPEIHQQFFPNYYDQLQRIAKELNK